VSSRNGAEFHVALFVGNIAVVVRMLSTEAPLIRLPEGTLLLGMVWVRFIALEAIGELGFASSAPLA